MEITSNVLLEVAKQRAFELEGELITYKALCLQQDLQIQELKKELNEVLKKLEQIQVDENLKDENLK